MARKKTVPIDPEISDSELEETQQLHEEGEAPAEDIPADALPGDEPAGEGSPDSELPLDGDTPAVSEGVPPFEERDTDIEVEAAAVDPASEGIPAKNLPLPLIRPRKVFRRNRKLLRRKRMTTARSSRRWDTPLPQRKRP